MKTKFYLLIICLGIFCSPVAMAQGKAKAKKVQKVEVSATVVDADSNPVAGVIVSANEGASKTVTDENGSFSLMLIPGSMVSFDCVGFESEMMTTAQIATVGNTVGLTEEALKNVYTEVSLPYRSKQQYKAVGAVSYVDVDAELERDNRTNIGSAIYGKVAGVTSLANMRGIGGGAITVVDGIATSITDLSLQEVESITVLKDAASRILYGAEGEQGVVFIKTKRGEANKQNIKFEVEGGLQNAISYPKFLTGADYMMKYNEAYRNDGNAYDYFDEDTMNNTFYNNDSVLYPNNDYYSSQWVRNTTNYTRLYGEASGGNSIASYFMSAGWSHNEGWLNNVDNSTDSFNVRGKIDLKVNSWLNLSTDVSTVFNLANAPYLDSKLGANSSYWDKAVTSLSTSFPLLIPIDRIANYDTLTGVSNIVDGKYLLGGTSVYTENLYGSLNYNGQQSNLDRTTMFKVGFNMDLSGITEGLSASGAGTYQFYNQFMTYSENEYAVYEVDPYSLDDDGMFNVTQHGKDISTTKSSVDASYSDFFRELAGYVSVNYDRSFGKHDVSAVAIGYGNQNRYKGLFQESRRLSTGLQATYMYDDKYIIDAALMYQGSGKMPKDNRWSSSPSVGAGWIVSNESFMADQDVVDYLKVRASYGVTKYDNWTNGAYKGYFLYQQIYDSSNVWRYDNNNQSNTSIDILSNGNNYGWQSRKELNIGFDAYIFNKSTWIEASYFNSTTDDMITELKNTTFAPAGGVTAFGNFNSVANRGFEIGINHSSKIGQVDLNVGLNYLTYNSEVLKNEEPIYSKDLEYLSRIGKSNSAMWALVADGLYSADDFNADGSLAEGVVKSSYATVQEGDIKYIDQNGDNVINQNDVVDTGFLSGNNNYLSLNVDLKYNNWQFFAQVAGAFGGKGYKNSNYYWFKGTEANYSDFAKKAYDVNNPNPNAECPRLTLTEGANNYRNSTFWMYDRSYASLEAVQLGYTFNTNGSVVKNLKLYLRGSNLFRIAKDKDVQQQTFNGNPQSRLYSVGIVTSF